MEYYDVDAGFFNNFRLTMVAGSSFDENVAPNNIIISEAALEPLHFNNAIEAINQTLWVDDSLQMRIAGVVKDFYHRGLETPYRPLVFLNRTAELNYLNLRVEDRDDEAVTAYIKTAWKKINPGQNFEGGWLYDELYERKSAWGTVSMLGFLALISVTLASLGLLGMVVYSTETRKKEIGIRKVMGASVTAIMALISKSFLRLVVIAGLIALPVSYTLGYFFLNLFANRVGVGAELLVFSFTGMLILSLLVICSQVYKAAAENPVKSLRTE
jgi:putative ABC transport system permease protein